MKPRHMVQSGLLVLTIASVLVTQVRAQTAAEGQGQDANDELQMGASIQFASCSSTTLSRMPSLRPAVMST